MVRIRDDALSYGLAVNNHRPRKPKQKYVNKQFDS